MAKTFVVTGASRGIGLAIAEYLISKSHNIVILARSSEPLEKLRTENPKQVRTLAGDLNDFAIAQRAVDSAIEGFGQLNGLVVNHGAMFGVNTVAECDIDEWRKMFDINYFSAVAFTQAALPALRKTKGSIVYTSTGASTGACQAWGAYSASKAAVNCLAKQIACEEPEVTAFSIRPGVVDTEMQRNLREAHAAKMADKDNVKFRDAYQNKTLLQPEQPGHVMAKLILDPDRSLNGQYLSWDGKELARYA